MGKKVPWMSKAEFSRALSRLHEMRADESLNLVDMTTKFDGFGLPDFEPVHCTLDELAQLIGWQCLQFNGELDDRAMDEIWQARRRFRLLGPGSDDELAQQRLNLERDQVRLEKERLFDKVMP